MEFLEGRVSVMVGDITTEDVDAIVNAANSSLLGGSGVDGAIHRAGGPSILEECRELRRTEFPNGLPTGEAVITTAGNMPAGHVIHTVGPIFGRNSGRDAELLAGCYTNSLNVAVLHSAATVAFPAISTGVYGYPKDRAAQVSSAAVADFIASNDLIREVRFVFHSQNDADIFLDNHAFPV